MLLKKITENIDKITVRFAGGMGEANCYLFGGDNGYTLIDTGMYDPTAIASWEELLNGGLEIEKIVLTHTHQDHIGLAHWFQQKGVPVYTSRLGKEEMEKRRDPGLMQRLDEMLKSHGAPGIPKKLMEKDESFIYDFEPDGVFDSGEMVQIGNDSYEVIWTPGHAPDHYCFYQHEQQIMIAGDHILHEISPVIGLWLAEENMNPLGQYYESLEKMNKYPAKLTVTGHGAEVPDLQLRSGEIKRSHDSRLEQVQTIVRGKEMTAFEICQEIYGRNQKMSFISPFMATLTRLVHLESLGAVRRVSREGNFLFEAAEMEK